MLRTVRSLAGKAIGISVMATFIGLGAVSCGGGGGGDGDAGGGGAIPTPAADQQTPPPSSPNTPSTPSSPSTPSTPSTPGSTPFTAFMTSAEPAPGTGTKISGTVALVVRGTSIANVELLPADGYEPRAAIFDVTQDHTKASVNFDTTKFPNGLLRVRIVAFNGQIGQPSSQIVAMETRTWQIENEPPPRWVPIPPASLMPEVWVWQEDLPYVDPTPLNEWLQLSTEALKERLVNDWDGFLVLYHRYAPENVTFRVVSPGHATTFAACFGDLITPDQRELYCRARLESIRNAMNNAPH